MPIIVLFVLMPVVALFIALSFFSYRPVLQKLAWCLLVFFSLLFAYSFRGVGVLMPFLVWGILVKLVQGEQPQLRGKALMSATWRRLISSQ